MARFAGTKQNIIYVISDARFVNGEYEMIDIPESLSNVSNLDVITHYKVKDGKIVLKVSDSAAKKLKVALVGNWKMKCGISTFSEKLWPEVAKLVGDVKLFVEKNDSPTSSILMLGDQQLREDQVVSCWKRSESLKTLVSEIKKYDPDIVFIQHEYGIFPNARYWLALMTQLSEYRIIATMHSVFHHLDKTIIEASIPEIVVHLEGAKTLLKKEKQIAGKVYVIPHGCDTYKQQDALWNFYRSNSTFVQTGFGFRYKSFESSIKAAAILKPKYPDVFFTALFSESDFNKGEHQCYYSELMTLINKLDVQDNVAILRGFQSDNVIDLFLRMNKATLFPYISNPAHEVFGATGAAREAMSKGVPVVTSSVNHFSDVPTIKAETPEEMAAELDKLFSDPKVAAAQVARQIKFLQENSWVKIAERYAALFES